VTTHDGSPQRHPTWVAPALLLLSGTGLILRQPDLILHPRFWAEDATVYFVGALAAPDAAAALTASYLGFYSLIANLAAWLATLVPLESAPTVMLGVAWATQMLPFLVVATGRAPIFATPSRKLVACLVLLLVGAAGELHLTVALLQFHMTVLAALIYLEAEALDRPAPGREGGLIALLALAGFSSAQACMLMPFFWLRRLRRRDRGAGRFDRVAALVLTTGILVQVSALMLAGLGGAPDRLTIPDDAGEKLWEFVQAMVKFPVFGDLSDKHGIAVLILVAAGSAAMAALQVWIARRGPHRDWLAIAWAVTLASVLLSRRMAGGERYQLMACVLLALLLLAVAIDAGQPILKRRLAGGLLAVALVTQAVLWPIRIAGSYDPDWPRWPEEVRAWRAGERDALRIHPRWDGTGWTVTLPERLKIAE